MPRKVKDVLIEIKEIYQNSPYLVLHFEYVNNDYLLINPDELPPELQKHKGDKRVSLRELFCTYTNQEEFGELLHLSDNKKNWIQKILYVPVNNSRRYYETQIFSPGKNHVSFLCRDVTDNYKREAQIELQDATLRNILDNSKDIQFCISYLTNRIEYISPAVKEILGYHQTMFLEKHPSEFYQLLHPDDKGIYKDFWKEIPVLEKQQIYLFKSEFRLKNSKDNYLWISQYHNLVIKENKPYYLICSLRDISEIKETEAALRESEERYSFAFDAANNGLWDYNPVKNKLFLSDSWFKMMGYKRKDFGDTIEALYELVHPDDREKLIRMDKKFFESDTEIFSHSYRILHASDTYKWIATKGKKIQTDEKGMITRIVGIHTDITERIEAQFAVDKKNEELKLAQYELRNKNKELSKVNNELKNKNAELEKAYNKLFENELVLRQFSENIGDVLWIRTESEIIYINVAFEQVWGRNRDEVLLNPQVLKDYVYEEDRDKFEVFTDISLIKNSSPYTEQYRIVKPGGDIRWIWARLFPVYNEKGELIQVAGIASDITDQKEFESTLKIAKERAQESDRLKSAFLANISHEIRTPMNGIIGFIDLLKSREIDDAIRDNYLEIIKKSSQQLVRIIDDIIEYSRIESKQISINSEYFDLNQVLKDLNLSFLSYFTNNNIQLELRLKPEVIGGEFRVYSDSVRIRQVLTNLVDNAIKYTKKGFIEYGYEIRTNDVLLYVKDTGIGIKKETEEFIFNRFRQGDEGHTRRYGGTGLGLSICKELVRLMEGEIWFTSELDKGSTFYFTIPYDSSEKHSTREKAKALRYNWSNKKFLIVEDDDLNFEYLHIALEATGAVISRAYDGSEAVKMCAEDGYDIILMDIRLPVINGFEATKKLRNLGITAPIIAQTAYSMDDDKEKSISAGCNDYITKPIEREMLLKKINKLLKPSGK